LRETIRVDIGNKLIIPVASPTTIHATLDYPPSCIDMTTRLVVADEGISPDSLTSCPVVFPDELMPPSLRLPAHKPDFIRLLVPRFVKHSNTKRRLSSIRKIQIGGWKY
jgi:hypothetical protein